jgi:hypothetical protein
MNAVKKVDDPSRFFTFSYEMKNKSVQKVFGEGPKNDPRDKEQGHLNGGKKKKKIGTPHQE